MTRRVSMMMRAGSAQCLDPPRPDAGRRRTRRGLAAALAVAIALASGAPLGAETVKKRNPTGSPLDTLMNTKLWPDVPEAKDFVRASRPSEDSLDYQPPWGAEPERPKLRSQAGLDDLRRELDAAAARNKARAAPPRPPAAQ